MEYIAMGLGALMVIAFGGWGMINLLFTYDPLDDDSDWQNFL